jgi:long-subunit acyl-CoA synthetase (AMP-forming)
MLYTSGTTGAAKGALLSHRTYYLQASQSHLTTGLTEEDIGMSMFPMFHMGGWALPLPPGGGSAKARFVDWIEARDNKQPIANVAFSVCCARAAAESASARRTTSRFMPSSP